MSRLTIPALAAALCLLAACQRPGPETPAKTPKDSAPAAATAPSASTPEAGAKAGANATGATVAVQRPTLKLPLVGGGEYDLANHRGQWVVVNFWATWCGPCLKEMPELSALDAMRDHVEVIGLAYEDIDVADMQAFLKQHPVVYPIAIVDTFNPPADFDTPRGLPMTYLIGPDGRVVDKVLGPVTAKSIEAAIAKAGGPTPG